MINAFSILGMLYKALFSFLISSNDFVNYLLCIVLYYTEVRAGRMRMERLINLFQVPQLGLPDPARALPSL